MKEVDYLRAGECYLAADEYDLANQVHLRGTRPAAEATVCDRGVGSPVPGRCSINSRVHFTGAIEHIGWLNIKSSLT